MAHPPPRNWAMAPPYHYHGTSQQEQAVPAAEDESGAGSGGQEAESRSLRIRELFPWMDEDYLRSCFTRSPELVTAVITRNKETKQSEGFGYLTFSDHATADQILQSYNGQKMPNADRDFSLSWVHYAGPDDNCAIYVGGLGFDVTDFMLHHVFKNRYPSVKRAKVIWDFFARRSKGYGFVVFGDVNERTQAMTEMNGAYCSSRPMRIGPATFKSDFRTQGTYSDSNQSNSRLFVGQLDSCVTDEDLDKAFSPYGELTVKVIEGKNCGFVTYSSRASAVEAMTILNGSQLGDNIITVNWARPAPKKQDQWNGVDYGHPQSSGPGYGCCHEDPNILGYTGHPGYAYHQQQQPQQTPVQ
ncbi:polyadenylate-binding protein RBP45-like isoform X1 [Triticum dicoccoides]|uniref:polyadenylate-binding protein RBP45-like isoform X1 n=1 Tax=Triticum dicoccoides TaxID=85692 RepID=UPI00188FA077|nr:polyadenylate-binding protein RBP45-like isoform X1 [Triticum dicoccoides]